MQVKVTIPYMPELSKNRGRKRNRYGRIYTDTATKAAMKAVAYYIMSKTPRSSWNPTAALRVDLGVFFKRAGTDPQNFVDYISDAIELGTGINDRYFIPFNVYGEKDAKNPRFEITLTQEEVKDESA